MLGCLPSSQTLFVLQTISTPDLYLDDPFIVTGGREKCLPTSTFDGPFFDEPSIEQHDYVQLHGITCRYHPRYARSSDKRKILEHYLGLHTKKKVFYIDNEALWWLDIVCHSRCNSKNTILRQEVLDQRITSLYMDFYPAIFFPAPSYYTTVLGLLRCSAPHRNPI